MAVHYDRAKPNEQHATKCLPVFSFSNSRMKHIFPALLLLSAVSLRADIVFNDFGASGSYNTSSYIDVPNYAQDLAVSFTPTVEEDVVSVTIALGSETQIHSGVFMYIATDDGGVPGTPLATPVMFNVSGPSGISIGPPSPPEVQFYTIIYLQAGQTYWLELDYGTDGTTQNLDWYLNNQGITGDYATSADGTNWTTESGTLPAFEVQTSPVPEPSTIALACVALAGLLFRGYWVIKTPPRR